MPHSLAYSLAYLTQCAFSRLGPYYGFSDTAASSPFAFRNRAGAPARMVTQKALTCCRQRDCWLTKTHDRIRERASRGGLSFQYYLDSNMWSCGPHHLFLGSRSCSTVPNTDVEVVLAELRAATADLARSANIAISRMVLRSKLAAAIADAGKAECAAEALRAAASTKVMEHE